MMMKCAINSRNVLFSPQGSIRIHSSGTWLVENPRQGKQTAWRNCRASSAGIELWQSGAEWATVLGSVTGRMQQFTSQFLHQLFCAQLLSVGILPRVRSEYHTRRIEGKLQIRFSTSLQTQPKPIDDLLSFHSPISVKNCRPFVSNTCMRRLNCYRHPL